VKKNRSGGKKMTGNPRPTRQAMSCGKKKKYMGLSVEDRGGDREQCRCWGPWSVHNGQEKEGRAGRKRNRVWKG